MSKDEYTRDHVTTNFFSKCCYKCQDRHVGCHGTCEKYLEAKKKHDEYKNKVFVKQAEEAIFLSYQKQACKRMRTVDNVKQRRNTRKSKYIVDVKD
jgi:hypothetical protein